MILYFVFTSLCLLVIILGYFRNKRAKKYVVRIVDGNCVGCQQCLKRCRHKALDTIVSDKRKSVVLKNARNCTACGDCIAVCKFNALELVLR